MKTSELIKQLQELQENFGDLKVNVTADKLKYYHDIHHVNIAHNPCSDTVTIFISL